MVFSAQALSLDNAFHPEGRGGITCLRLQDFRSYQSLRLICDPRPVVLTGSNGAGKTNILEALSFLTPGRGLRAQKLSQVLRRAERTETPAWYVSVDVFTSIEEETITLGTGYEASLESGREKRIVKVAGELTKSQSALSDYISVNWLTPQMDGLFQDNASERRKFLDRLICAFDEEHASRIYRYEYALRERSRLLRQGIRDPHWFNALEETMASSGTAIAYARQEAVAWLSRATDWALGVFPQAELRLEGSMDVWMQSGVSALEVEERLKNSLERSRAYDAEYGSAQEGCHRTDLIATYKEKNMLASNCSTGEQKALLLSLVMASIRVQSTHQKVVSVVLLDEVVAHLDEERRKALYEEIKNLKTQVWMTGTDYMTFAPLQDDAQYFMVENSHINSQDR